MAVAIPGLSSLLDTLTRSLSSASEATSKINQLQPHKGGISLLDVKNELLLSYLHNLVFLILLKIRRAKSGTDSDEDAALDEVVVRKLVELRVYLEKGTRPLEDKLRYQIEQILRAADDSERLAQAQVAKANKAQADDDDESASDPEAGSDAGSDDEDSTAEPREPKPMRSTMMGSSTAGPGLANFEQSRQRLQKPTAGGAKSKSEVVATGVYKPPRITRAVMPTAESREKAAASRQRPLRSATMDEFVADELSSAPTAQPSIGTTIRAGGLKIRTAADRKLEDERRDYEEKNFVRLPKESKKERQKRGDFGGKKREVFGGEEWRELGDGVDRINRVTAKQSSSYGTKAILDKSRKRGRDTVDGPRGSGAGIEMGESYLKRLKSLHNEKGRGRKK